MYPVLVSVVVVGAVCEEQGKDGRAFQPNGIERNAQRR
jgi:hypothetical protein